MPASMWSDTWQWNIHSPTLSAFMSAVTMVAGSRFTTSVWFPLAPPTRTVLPCRPSAGTDREDHVLAGRRGLRGGLRVDHRPGLRRPAAQHEGRIAPLQGLGVGELAREGRAAAHVERVANQVRALVLPELHRARRGGVVEQPAERVHVQTHGAVEIDDLAEREDVGIDAREPVAGQAGGTAEARVHEHE